MATAPLAHSRATTGATLRSLNKQTALIALAVASGVVAASSAVVTVVVVSRIVTAVVILLSAWWILAPAFRRRSRAKPLGQRVLLRSVLIGSVAVSGGAAAADTRDVGASVVAPTLATLLMVGALVVERTVARLTRSAGPYSHNLPGVETVPRLPDLSRPIVIGNLVAAAAGLILQTGGPIAWLWTAIAFLVFLPTAALGILGFRRISANRSLTAAMSGAIADFAPEFIVYTARPDDASYQVRMWLPHLERTGRRFLIVTRKRRPAEILAETTTVPIVTCPKVADLEALLVPSLRAAFYVNASSGNGAFIRNRQVTHVYLGHGDSDKPPSYNPTHAMYDAVFAAGPAAVRRYADHGVNIPANKFRVVGRPQVEDVQIAEHPISAIDEPTVLYAPTWRGHVEETKLDSLPVGEEIVRALLARGVRVIFRPHPFSYSFAEDAATIERIQTLLATDTERGSREHRWGEAAETDWTILDCINASDAMISDVSSVVSDYLFSAKPFAMVAVPSAPDTFIQQYPVAHASYVLANDLSNLPVVLDELLQHDSAKGRRRAVRADYLGDFPPEDYGNVFVQAVHALTAPASAHSTAPPGAEPGAQSAVPDDDRPASPDDESPSPADSLDGPEAALGTDSEPDLSDTGSDRPPPLPKRLRSSWRRELVELLQTVLLPSTAVLSLFGALFHQHPTSVLFGALTLVFFLFLHRRGLARRRSRNRMLASFGSARALTALACGVLWLDQEIDWWAVAAACALVSSVGAERAIANGWRRIGIQSSGLPELANPTTEHVPRWLVPLTFVAAVGIGYALALAQWPAWMWFLVAVAQLLVMATALRTAELRVLRAAQLRDQLAPALQRLAPEFVVYFASTMGARYQLGMWLPYFDRVGRPYLIVVREPKMLREVASLTDVPVIHRPTLRSLDELMLPTLTAAFYVNNAVRNTHLIERRELTHVWLNHGDSEKPACYNPVHAIYDLLFVAGQAGIDRYARHGVEIPEEKFRIVGRPQVEQIEPAQAPIGDIATPTVLYAPTWRGAYADSLVYSLPQGAEIVQALLDRGVRVIFRTHPFNHHFAAARKLIRGIQGLLSADAERTGRDHLFGAAAEREMSVEDCFNASDAMISDISAVVSDYLQSGKPLSIVGVGHTLEDLHEEVPASRAAYVLREDLSNLDAVLGSLLEDDPKMTERERTRVYHLSDFTAETYADGFLDAARTVIDSPRHSTQD